MTTNVGFEQKEIGFIDLSDGTCFKKLQIVYDHETKDFVYKKISILNMCRRSLLLRWWIHVVWAELIDQALMISSCDINMSILKWHSLHIIYDIGKI